MTLILIHWLSLSIRFIYLFITTISWAPFWQPCIPIWNHKQDNPNHLDLTKLYRWRHNERALIWDLIMNSKLLHSLLSTIFFIAWQLCSNDESMSILFKQRWPFPEREEQYHTCVSIMWALFLCTLSPSKQFLSCVCNLFTPLWGVKYLVLC